MHLRHLWHLWHLWHPWHPWHPGALAAAALLFLAGDVAAQEAKVTVDRRAVLTATITATCDRCDWAIPGREAIVLRVSVDGKYSQHLPLVRTGRAEYRVLLGEVEAGTHRVDVTVDRGRTSQELRDANPSARVEVRAIVPSDPAYLPLSLTPVLHERPNTAGRFSDVPVFMWYEEEPSERGKRYRYSVIFTNEDGGTPADRLMATWGRTTDIEYVYSVEVDRAGRIVDEDYQGPKHEILKFKGKREAQRPLLWVVTDNNMVADAGTSETRYAPAPVQRPWLAQVEQTREEVMDQNRWLYAVMTKELEREGKIVPNAPPGKGAISDPRRYIYLDACADVGENALAFSILVGDNWIPSDRGLVDYRVARDGCFRAAVPLPPEAKNALAVKQLRVHAYERAGRVSKGPVRLRTIYLLFSLSNDFSRTAWLKWTESATLQPNGPPLELLVR